MWVFLPFIILSRTDPGFTFFLFGAHTRLQAHAQPSFNICSNPSLLLPSQRFSLLIQIFFSPLPFSSLLFRGSRHRDSDARRCLTPTCPFNANSFFYSFFFFFHGAQVVNRIRGELKRGEGIKREMILARVRLDTRQAERRIPVSARRRFL